jgi:hypothetical protein
MIDRKNLVTSGNSLWVKSLKGFLHLQAHMEYLMELTLVEIEELLDKMQQATVQSSMVETESEPTMKVPVDLLLEAF